MRWRGILALPKHAHSVGLSYASVNCPTKAAYTSFWSTANSQTSTSSSLRNQVRAASTSQNVILPSTPVVKNIVTETSSTAESGKVSSSRRLKSRPLRSLDINDKARTDNVDRKGEKSQTLSKVALKGVGVSQKSSKSETVPGSEQKALFHKNKEDREAESQAVRLSECSSLTEDNAILRHVGALECATEFQSGQNFVNELSNDPSVAAAVETEEISGEEVGVELKKGTYTVSFPVSVLSEWWQSCFVRNARTCVSLNHRLFKIHVWLAAYQRAHRDATGKYTDGQSAAVLIQQLRNIRDSVVNGNFHWSDNKHIYLARPVVSSEEEKRKISETDVNPTFQDCVVQEVLYLVLEPIFETRFSARSHACRPGRDACTTLKAVKASFLGCTWFITGHLAILHEQAYATQLVDRISRFVKDPRINFLLKSGFAGNGIKIQGSCSNLRHLLCNVFLDQLDWWMDEQILSLFKREESSVGSSSCSSSKVAKSAAEKPCKLEYIRYGTEFLAACNGSEGDAEVLKQKIELFFQQKFGWDTPTLLQLSHISVGVPFLDHIVSQKVVRRIILQRKSSNGRVCVKRDFRIRLCFRASRESCLLKLQKVGVPTNLQDIKQVLSVLRCWYQCAENKERVIDYCKFMLCLWYAKGICKKDKRGSMDHDLARYFNEAIEMVTRDNEENGRGNTCEYACDWVEFEKALRNFAWLQNETILTQLKSTSQNIQSLPHQQHMSQIVRHYLGGGYGVKGDNGWELESQIQISNGGEKLMTGSSEKELAQSMG